ncbi:hypothetical protein EJ08DRAFT_643613 [Tothia fuscella]|uniref:Uncharacterized protein n=1 Tax=Tothia fuscella TaxID=1048955 RepID=A0A9P4NED5_9PEZI|nr:hypothetical protein EJ08DRAFT_643613 [Tothia fuscella]
MLSVSGLPRLGYIGSIKDEPARTTQAFARHRRCPYDPKIRTRFGDTGVSLFAWRARGGVIVLDDAEAMDFRCLGFEPLNPPNTRFEDQAKEDAFCQRLLLLGAKWWDNQARHSSVTELERAATGRGYSEIWTEEDEPAITMSEKRWIKVAWPSTGGLWVAEFDTSWATIDEMDNLAPEDVARLRLAQTMDERACILQNHFQAKFYKDVVDYQGFGFLNNWSTKHVGEVGALLQPEETAQLWRNRKLK